MGETMQTQVNGSVGRVQVNRGALKQSSALMSCGAFGLVLAFTACVTNEAYAEDTPTYHVDDIIVTAQKREERLRDIPQSVSAFTGEALEVRGISSTDDLGRQTPGLVLSKRLDNTPNVVIRGIGSFGNTVGVGFYVDDVQNFTDQTMRLQDLERVEILKGPQGTLYGGSNIGGAIKFVSKKPSLKEVTSDLSAELGSRNYVDLYGSVNLPLAPTTAVRLSAYRTQDDGYIKNNLLGIDAAKYVEWGIRGQVLFQPTDDFHALVTFRHRDLDGGSQNYSRQNDIRHPVFFSNTNVANFQKRVSSSVILDLEYDFGGASLTSISSYTRLKIRSAQDVDYTTVPAQRSEAFDVPPSKVYTQELRLTSETGGTFDWLVGAYISRQDNIHGLPAKFSLFAGPFAFTPALEFRLRQADIAAFGSANLHFGQFTLTGGLRWLDTKYTYHGITRAFVFGSDVPKIVNSDKALLPRLALSYKTDNNTLLYASVSRGYESGKVTILSDPPFPYDPETTWAFELGAKGDLGRQLRYEAAVFYTAYQDRQIETRIFDPNLGITGERVDNIGDSASKGFELSAVWTPVSQLDLSAAAAYTDAKWKNAVFGVDNGAGGTTNLQLHGDRIPNSPKWMLNFATDYRIPAFGENQITFHADASYMSNIRYRLVATGPTTFAPSHWIANARIGFGPESGVWEVAGRVENIFDKSYFNEFGPQTFGPQNPDGTCTGCHLGSPASPRRFLASVRGSF